MPWGKQEFVCRTVVRIAKQCYPSLQRSYIPIFYSRNASHMGMLDNKVILLTGASKGIGAATAGILGAEGASVIAHYNSDRSGAEAALADVPAGQKTFLGADAGDMAQIDRLFAEAVAWKGRVDVVVLNAAIMLWTGGIEDDIAAWDQAWDQQFRVNVLSPTRLMRHAVQHFKAQGGGALVTISSWAAQRGVTNPAMISYAATKASVKAAAQTIARGYARDNIQSYIVAPGVVRTRMSEDFAALQGGEAIVSAGLAMGEWVPPTDIGHVVAFLSSGRAKHLSGSTVDVNGASYVR
jgi:NAD(P)-dependent dehydrogenase (short-subunit alcohol dehydrogenase family)